MGCYDVLGVNCFNCGTKLNSQTKLLGLNDMSIYVTGNEIRNINFKNCIFGMKNNCLKCKKYSAIVIKNGKIGKVVDAKDADIQELMFGDFKWLKTKLL